MGYCLNVLEKSEFKDKENTSTGIDNKMTWSPPRIVLCQHCENILLITTNLSPGDVSKIFLNCS